MRLKSRTFALTLILVSLAAPALADAGTPLMWASAFHLIVGNLFIGIFEALLVCWLFKYPRRRAVPRAILANYFSSFVGFFLLYPIANLLEPHLPGAAPLYRWPLLMVCLAVISWILSIVPEWPFWVWIIGGVEGRLKRAWIASLIAQTASYALLVAWYLVASDLSFYRTAHIQHNLTFVHQPAVSVYYINQDDGAVWRIKADGTGQRKVVDAKIHDTDARLFTRLDPKTGRCNLGWVTSGPGSTTRTTILLPGIARRCPVRQDEDSRGEEDDWFSFGKAADLRGDHHSGWSARTGFWAFEGINVERDSRQVYHLGLEVPYTAGYCRDGTILPGDQLVFEMSGMDEKETQIVILDLLSRKLSVLTMGQGPVAVIGDEPPARPRAGAGTF